MRRYACYTDSSRTKFLGYVTGITYWEADKNAAERFGGTPYLMMCA